MVLSDPARVKRGALLNTIATVRASIPLKNMLEMGAHSPLKNLFSREREELEIRADGA